MIFGRGQGLNSEWLENYILAHWRDLIIRQCIQDGKYIIFKNELQIDSKTIRKEYQRRDYIARTLAWMPEEEKRIEKWKNTYRQRTC